MMIFFGLRPRPKIVMYVYVYWCKYKFIPQTCTCILFNPSTEFKAKTINGDNRR